VDVHTPEQRSRNMAAIRSKDTKPELAVRSLIHQLGYRFRLHRSDLPGRPDIVLPRHRIVIFVHGCFWHMHRCRFGKVKPENRADFWSGKRLGNVQRDKKQRRKLRRQWSVLVVWECQTKSPKTLQQRLLRFLEQHGH
jgi:DNA mismatch endonuclease, patch repair protein